MGWSSDVFIPLLKSACTFLSPLDANVVWFGSELSGAFVSVQLCERFSSWAQFLGVSRQEKLFWKTKVFLPFSPPSTAWSLHVSTKSCRLSKSFIILRSVQKEWVLHVLLVINSLHIEISCAKINVFLVTNSKKKKSTYLNIKNSFNI